METWMTVLVTAAASILASSGFWAFLQRRLDKHSLRSKLLLGLAHDKIIELGMKYIDRGSISRDEYENLVDYLYIPYKEMGGNGAAERVINEVKKLKITETPVTWPEVDRRKYREGEQS